MNKRIKELLEKANELVRQDLEYSPAALLPQELVDEKFAELIIKEVSAQPKVYLLNVLDATDPDAVWELHGWTNDLKLAQQWREKSSMHQRHNFTDLFFVKKIETLE